MYGKINNGQPYFVAVMTIKLYNTYKAQDTNVLFVKFATTMNIDNFT